MPVAAPAQGVGERRVEAKKPRAAAKSAEIEGFILLFAPCLSAAVRNSAGDSVLTETQRHREEGRKPAKHAEPTEERDCPRIRSASFGVFCALNGRVY